MIGESDQNREEYWTQLARKKKPLLVARYIIIWLDIDYLESIQHDHQDC